MTRKIITDEMREAVARAIAQQGFGRPWDDFYQCDARDTDQNDLIEYAQAALEAAVPLIAAAERAACAEIAEDYEIGGTDPWTAPSRIAKAIRSRGGEDA